MFESLHLCELEALYRDAGVRAHDIFNDDTNDERYERLAELVPAPLASSTESTFIE